MLLVRANARLQQSDSVAQTTGPAVAGWFIQLLTAPAALLIDAASYFMSGLVVASIPEESAKAPPSPGARGFRQLLLAGPKWLYRHPRLAPLAWATHAWFVFFSMFNAVFTVYALKVGRLEVPRDASCAMVGFMLNANKIEEAGFTALYGR